MKFLYLVLVYFTSVSADCPTVCDGVCIKNKYHSIRLIRNKLREVHDLVYNPNDESVYMVYSNPLNNFEKEWARHLGSISLKTGEFWRDTGFVYWPSAIALAPETDVLYAGGADGLYKIFLDAELIRFTKIKTVEDGITSLFLSSNRRLYYVNQCGDSYVYAYDEVCENLILENFHYPRVNVDKLVIDKFYAMVFIDNGTVFCVPNNNVGPSATEIVRIAINDANDIAIDPIRDVFIATKRGVFAYDSTTNNLTRYGSNMENIKKLTFAGVDEPIFVVNDKLYAFVPN